jgi:hypothetical protein
MESSTITTEKPKFNPFQALVTSGTQSQAERDWYNLKMDRLYLIKVTRHLRGKFYESFVKIGWTTEFDLQKRFNWFPATFEVELIDTICLPKNVAHLTELRLHKFYKPFRYKPLSKFSGKEEAYTYHLIDNYKTLTELIDNIDREQPTENSLCSLN